MKLYELMALVPSLVHIEVYDRETGKRLARTAKGLEKFTACYVYCISPKQKVEKHAGSTMLRPYLHVWVGMPKD